jgi:hypothetical protein
MKEKRYGHPDNKEQGYFPEVYCVMCNRIPLMDLWDPSTGKIVGEAIDELYPIETKLGIGPDRR